jgi:hypothetical protein
LVGNGDKCKKISAAMRKKLRSEGQRLGTREHVHSVKAPIRHEQHKHVLNAVRSVADDS